MQRNLYLMLSMVLGLFALLVIGMPLPGQASAGTIPLQEGLGPHHYPISTDVVMAQRYFDQGLMLSYGFNHAEAARSFREAQSLDPTCAMCYWGEALVLGPNINAPMDPSMVPKAFSAVEKALALKGAANPKERALIQAVATRYSKDALKDRSPLDVAYAEAMRRVAKQFPDDPVIGALLAEALMDLHPWNFWSKQGEAKPWTREIVSTLEAVLDKAPDHPLANHLYIHTMEASLHPDKAIPSAERLPDLAPGSGHLVHMPAHIFIRVGRYRDAVLANQRAVKVDKQYLSHSHEESLYTAAYVPHNYHFLWAAAIKIGREQLAMQAALDTAAQVNPAMMRDPDFGGTLQHFWSIPLYTQAVFGHWPEILAEPAPPEDLRYPTAVWHYVRGIALVRHGKLEAAQQELAQLTEIAREPAVANLSILNLNAVVNILKIGEAVLAGEIAAGHGDYETAVHLLHLAVQVEDGLNYTEPKDWYLPSRQALGAMLLEAGKPAEAERAFREDLQDHPQNGWSLLGLEQSLRAQEKTAEAEIAKRAFQEIWGEADVTLTTARF